MFVCVECFLGFIIEDIKGIEGVENLTGLNTLAYALDEEVGTGQLELDAELWHLQNKRVIKMHKHLSPLYKKQEHQITPLKIYHDEQNSLNEAEIYLLHDELSTFTQALIQHPILLPTSFSQHLSMDRKVYCIRLKSCEPFEGFIARLTAAMRKLG